LLPYYKFLFGQPGLFYESEDVETLRLLIAFPKGLRKLPSSEKKDEGGGEINAK